MVNRKLQSALIGLSSALILAGCATLSKDECLMGDWYDIGIQDGAAGYAPESRLAQHGEACAEFRVRPDRGAYQAGWDRGIGEYCTPDRGFQEGRRGASYAHVCPPPLEWAFLEGYRNGQQLYRQEQRVREMEAELDRKRKEARKRDEDRRRADEDWRKADEYRRKTDEDRRRADEDRRRRDSTINERPRSDYRQIQPVGPPIRIDERAEQEKQRQIEQLQQMKRLEEDRKRDEERRKADEERRRRESTTNEQHRSDNRQIQLVAPPIRINERAE